MDFVPATLDLLLEIVSKNLVEPVGTPDTKELEDVAEFLEIDSSIWQTGEATTERKALTKEEHSDLRWTDTDVTVVLGEFGLKVFWENFSLVNTVGFFRYLLSIK